MTDRLIVTRTDRALLGALGPHPELQRELDRAVLVPSEAVPADVVTMNSSVAFRDETAGVRRVVTIVFPGDADASSGRISVLSPIGTALLGLSAGQAIDWDFPDGSRRRLRVDELVRQPERRLSRQPGFRMRSRVPFSESILDAAIECTFPASDPIAVQSAFEAACEREDALPDEISGE